MPDYVPKSDSGFSQWAKTFVEYAAAHAAELGLDAGLVTRLQDRLAEWQTRFREHAVAQRAAKAATQVKNQARAVLKDTVREAAMAVQHRRLTTDGQRRSLGINVPDREPTPLSPDVVLQLTPPLLRARCIEAQTVRIDWAHGKSRKLPDGVDKVELWFAERPAPGAKPAWQYLAHDSRSPYIHKVGNSATVTLLYRARWSDRLNRPGPFGDEVTVAVTA